MEAGSFRLCSQRPRRVFENCLDSLETAGLTQPQEMLFVEMLG